MRAFGCPLLHSGTGGHVAVPAYRHTVSLWVTLYHLPACLTPKAPNCSTPALGMPIIVLGCGPCSVGPAGVGELEGSTEGAAAKTEPFVGSP